MASVQWWNLNMRLWIVRHDVWIITCPGSEWKETGGGNRRNKNEEIWVDLGAEASWIQYFLRCASHLKGIADRKWINDSPARMLRVSCVELTRQCSHKITLSLMKDGCMQLQVIGTHRSSLPSELVCGKHCSSQVKGAPVASKLKVHGEHYFTSLSGRSSLSRV